MEKILVFLVFGLIIVLGFLAMNKIDIFRRERSRRKGLPMDEED